jgi:hypothetical protein
MLLQARPRDASDVPVGDWRSLTGWRLDDGVDARLPRWHQYRVQGSGASRYVRVHWLDGADGVGCVDVWLDTRRHRIRFDHIGDRRAPTGRDAGAPQVVEIDGLAFHLSVTIEADRVQLSDGVDTIDARVLPALDASGRSAAAGEASLLAPLMGKVLSVRVAPGRSGRARRHPGDHRVDEDGAARAGAA